jgi:hypothetical protein
MEPVKSAYVHLNELKDNINKKYDELKKSEGPEWDGGLGHSIVLSIDQVTGSYDCKLPIEKIEMQAKVAFSLLSKMAETYLVNKDVNIEGLTLIYPFCPLPRLLKKLNELENQLESEDDFDHKNPWAPSTDRERYDSYQKLISKKSEFFGTLVTQRERVIKIICLKCLQSSSTTTQDLDILREKCQKYKDFKDYSYDSKGLKGLYYKMGYENLRIECHFGSRYENTPKGTIERNCASINFGGHPSFGYERPVYTPLSIFFSKYENPSLHNANSCSLDQLFSSQTLEWRIYLAIFLDNPSILKIFLEEYQKLQPNLMLSDFIANRLLFGIAAANGCFEVIKYLVEKKLVNLEQKFTIPNEKQQSLTMTALGLAINAAPKIPREKAFNLIQTLVSLGANYNSKVITSWSESHGYYGNTTSLKTSATTLFTFDTTGILQDVKKMLHTNRTTNKNYSTESESISSSNPEIDALRLEVQELNKKNASLEVQIKALWREFAKLQQMKENDGEKREFAPKSYRGRGRGRGGGVE